MRTLCVGGLQPGAEALHAVHAAARGEQAGARQHTCSRVDRQCLCSIICLMLGRTSQQVVHGWLCVLSRLSSHREPTEQVTCWMSKVHAAVHSQQCTAIYTLCIALATGTAWFNRSTHWRCCLLFVATAAASPAGSSRQEGVQAAAGGCIAGCI